MLLFSTIVDPANQAVCVYAETSVGNGSNVLRPGHPTIPGCFTVPQGTVAAFDGFN